MDTEYRAFVDGFRDLTESARAKGWDLFSPRWDVIAEYPAMQLRSLCALSLGMHPYFAVPFWVENVAIPHFDGSLPDGQSMQDIIAVEWLERDLGTIILDETKDLAAEKRLLEFIHRTNAAVGNLVPHGKLKPVKSDDAADDEINVYVSEFAAWAENRGWSLPAEFPRHEALSVQAAPVQTDSDRQRRAVNARHDQPGGTRERTAAMRTAWATGQFKSRKECADLRAGALCISIRTARKALINTPDPDPWPKRYKGR